MPKRNDIVFGLPKIKMKVETGKHRLHTINEPQQEHESINGQHKLD